MAVGATTNRLQIVGVVDVQGVAVVEERIQDRTGSRKVARIATPVFRAVLHVLFSTWSENRPAIAAEGDVFCSIYEVEVVDVRVDLAQIALCLR